MNGRWVVIVVLLWAVTAGQVTRVAPDEHVSLQIDHNHLIQQRMGSSIFADLPPLQPSTHYELRINYPATNPTLFVMTFDTPNAPSPRQRDLLNTEKIMFITDERGRVHEAALLSDVSGLHALEEKMNKEDPLFESLQLAISVCTGDFITVLKSSLARDLLPQLTNISSLLDQQLDSLSGASYDHKALTLALLGAACLGAFVQLNWTGPPFDLPEGLFTETLSDDEIENRLFVEGGESVYSIIVQPQLLLAARSLLCFPYSASPSLFSLPWWAIRCLRVQQTTLTDRAPALKMAIKRHIATIEEFLSLNSETMSVELTALHYIEKNHFFYYYREIPHAITALSIARQTTGLDIEVSGALGKRTKFQQKDTSQLIVRASSRDQKENPSEEEEATTNKEELKTAPRQVDQEHELLLKSTAFREEQFHGHSLSLIDQTLMLSLLCVIKASNPQQDPLAVEERLAFLHRVGMESKNWMIHSAFLLYKAQIESEAMKTFDRGLLQIQSLVDQYEDKEPASEERLRFIYSLNFPPRHLLKQELGRRYLKYGIAASARDIFLELGMWEDLIRSYIIMGEPSKAATICKERLEIKATPELWCILGELESNLDHYRTAWELSRHRFAQAQRLLGKALLRRQEWEEAITSLRLSLDLNPLYPGIWFSLGCCYMQTSQWEEGARAFTQCVQQEMEDGDAWANLSTCLQQQDKLPEALAAAQEALKQKQDSWKMWENTFLLSLRCGDFAYALTCMNRLLDLRGSEVKFSWIKALVSYILKSLEEHEEGSRVVEFQSAQVELLLGRATDIMPSHAELWEIYANLHLANGKESQALDCRQKQVRLLAKAEVLAMTNEDFTFLVEAEDALAELFLRTTDRKPIHAFVLHLRSLIRKTEERFSTHESYARLQAIEESIKAKEQELKA